MIARLLVPDRVVLEAEVEKVIADTMTGSRCFLPRHIDFATPLVAGIVTYHLVGGEERFAAIESGVLTKKASELLVVSWRAVVSESLDDLSEQMMQRVARDEELERASRRAMAQLETRLVKELLELVR